MSAKQAFRLTTALLDQSALRQYIRQGLGAMRNRDVDLIAEAERVTVADSIDLDAAMRRERPQANRWDYLVSVPAALSVVGIEPHTAKDSEITVVIAKRAEALAYLRDHLRTGHRVARWLWVSSGKVGFSAMERARRRLAQKGIEFVGREVRRLGGGE